MKSFNCLARCRQRAQLFASRSLDVCRFFSFFFSPLRPSQGGERPFLSLFVSPDEARRARRPSCKLFLGNPNSRRRQTNKQTNKQAGTQTVCFLSSSLANHWQASLANFLFGAHEPARGRAGVCGFVAKFRAFGAPERAPARRTT